ncbi:MAG: protein-export chaperone SecB [Casimicrobiaceae bacterium]|nr:protein-export chaperone SecB [Casimicrobiaceae bacterium]MDW8312710.1 protein-export chaperone SecB [Burkholderiales bacterium]
MADTPPLQSDPNAPVFTIEKLYVKDLSVENPNAPQSYLWREAPSVEVTLDHESTPIEEGFYNVLIKATVTATIADRTLFLVEGALGGIFQIRNIAQADLAPVLGVHCPNILFPYLREVISDAVNRMGYPSIYLQPVNFEAIYQARLQRELAQQAAAGGPATLQ